MKRRKDTGRLTFTTGDVARICEVSARTAGQWIDSGQLPGFRLPAGRSGGGLDRRVYRTDLVRFLKDRGFRLPHWLAPANTLLLVTGDGHLASELTAALSAWTVNHARDLFDAAMMALHDHPAVVALDFGLGRLDCLAAAPRLAAMPRSPVLLAITAEDEVDPLAVAAAGFRRAFQRPVDIATIAGYLQEEP